MNLQDLGSLGEFFGFVAVLGTLLYLSLQTRQTRQIAASEIARSLISDFREIWTSITQNHDFAELMIKGTNDWDSLSQVEQLQVHSFLVEITVHFVAATQADYIKDLETFVGVWEDNLLGVLQTPGGRVWWETCQSIFHPPVRERLNRRLEDRETLPPPWTAIPWWRAASGDR